MINRSFDFKLNTNIQNFINNPKINLKTKGLLVWLLSQPDDFKLNTKDISVYNKDSANSTYTAIRELEKLGYVEAINPGTSEMYYNIYDTPQIANSTKFKEQERTRRRADNITKTYIRKYLVPDRHFKRVWSIDTYLYDLQNPEFAVDWNFINGYINHQLSYDEFLRTEYWEIISIWKKVHSNFTCEKCGKKFNIMSKLNIHHKTYEIHGQEHLQTVIDNDLCCLCEDCHMQEHKLNPELTINV